METFTSLTPQQLRRAADVKERIDTLQKELAQLLGASAPAPAAAASQTGPEAQTEDFRGRPGETGRLGPRSLGKSQSRGQDISVSGSFRSGAMLPCAGVALLV